MTNLTREDRKILRNILVKQQILGNMKGRRGILVDAGLDKLIPMIQLEGDTRTVIGEIISFLENYGYITPENHALGCFLNVVKEDLLGIEEERIVARILEDYNLMIPIAESPSVDNWKGKSTPNEIKEAILGENTLKHIAFLNKGVEVAKAVVRVIVGASSQGTGFMITPDLLLTNHHVLSEKELLSTTRFEFNYQLDIKGNALTVGEFSAKEDGLYHSNKELDYAIVELDDSPGNKFAYLTLHPLKAFLNQRVNIIQHPYGLPKQISIQNNFVEYRDKKLLQYLTTTMKGSSGSPVFNDDWEVVALHHAGGMLLEPETKRRYFRNEGILISAILDDLPEAIKERLK